MNEVDQYISTFPRDVRGILKKIRSIIKEAAPDAEEGIAYQMPAYKTNNKPLVYFGAFKKHIGFYATPSAHAEFSPELAKYKGGKGSVQFPLDAHIPFDLIKQLVEFKVHENKE